MTSLTYLPVNNRFKICGYSLQGYCKFINTNLSEQNLNYSAESSCSFKCDGHIFKKYFPCVALIILSLFCIFLLKNNFKRHDGMHQTQTAPETSQRKWDKLLKY